MGILQRLGFARDVLTGPTFTTPDDSSSWIDTTDIDPAVFGLAAWSSTIGPEPRVNRRLAIQVPAVKRARDIICSLGSLPLTLRNSDREIVTGVVTSSLLDQPERNRPRSVTMAQLFDDLLFEGVAWWMITDFGWSGYPINVVRLDPRTVTTKITGETYVSRAGVHGTSWEYVPDAQIIRFDSPNDGLLDAGARAIRVCLKLDAAASRYADEPMPSGYFAPKEGADPASDDDLQQMLDTWASNRRVSGTAYIPAALSYQTVQWSPEQLQLTQARQHAVLEIARLTGIDAEDLGVSTTSRTYANSEDRTRALINQTLGAYAQAVEDRLSMNDITPRSYRAVVELDDMLKADTLQRMQAYATGLDVGAITRDEIRALENRPDLKPSEIPVIAPATPVPTAISKAVADATTIAPNASAEVESTFEGVDVLAFDNAETGASFEVNADKRTIRGLAVPYGQSAVSRGRRYSFSKGSMSYGDPSRVKLLVQHDFSQAVGKATSFEDTDAGLVVNFKVARGDAGDRALMLAEDGVLDGLSVGIALGGKYDDRDGVMHAVSVPLAEVSLTPSPAFADARVLQVTASNTTDERNVMPEVETPESTEATAPDFSQQIGDAVKAAFEAHLPNQREVIKPATSAATFSVTEEPLYAFEGRHGKHEFSTDVFSAAKGDREAEARITEFMAAEFEVTRPNVAAVNPNIPRPDLYVDQRVYQYPLWNAVNKGSLQDSTPFVVPKFNSSSGLVGDHTEGVEPTPGAFTATSATITPTAVSGKVEVTCEVIDQGGNPQVSTLIWQQMTRAYYEALEAFVVSTLDAAAPTGITIAAGAADDVLDAALTDALSALQYIRGGFAFDTFAVQVDLFQALANAVDANGRHLFPMIGPMNANGTASPLWASLNVGGLRAFPAWALAATGGVAASSYLFDRNSVSAWATAPRKLQFEYQVAHVDLAIWGYKAAAITDLTGVREIVFDPTA